jgi:cell division protein FtsN
MERRTVFGRGRWVVLSVAVILFVLEGCAAREMGGAAPQPATREGQASPRANPPARSDTLSRQAPYNLEEEMPEKAPQRPVEVVEKLTPIQPDTFNVQDIETQRTAKEALPKQLYDIGYRIQVFASSDKAAAENVKQRVVAETGMPAYLEYEEGLYKVRAGDFAERKDAAQARLRLVERYPGSWIVRTTIRKAS